MVYEIRLKAGFFETRLYTLEVTHRQIKLTPVNSGDVITIKDKALIAVTILNIRHPEIEIQTITQTYFGNFTGNPDLAEICRLLKKELSKKIIYEGGFKNF